MKPTAMLSPNGQQTTQGEGPATRLLVATLKGVLTLDRAAPGSPWAIDSRSLADRHVGALLHEPYSGKLFAGAHGDDGGLWISDDGAGASWRRATNGLTCQHVYSLAARHHDKGVTLFAGTEPAAFYRSDDLGESWRELPALRGVPGTEKWTFPAPPHIAHVKNITVHPNRATTLFTCVEQGALLKSEDEGESWVELDSYALPDDATYRDAHRLMVHPNDDDVLYLTTGSGLNRSADGGRTWTALSRRKDRVGYPDFLCFDPRNSDIMYMAGGAESPTQWMVEHVSYAAVLKSADAGRTWRELGNGLPHPMIGSIEGLNLHRWPEGMTLTIGTATGDIYVSEDAGESWARIVTGLPPISKSGHYRAFLPPGTQAPRAPAPAGA